MRARHSAVRVRTASCECEGSVQSILQCAAVAGVSAAVQQSSAVYSPACCRHMATHRPVVTGSDS